MRKLIYAINITLDGNCDHTKAIADEELHEYHTRLVKEADTFVYGRKIYQLMVPFWPDVAKNKSGHSEDMIDFAEAFAAIKKIVVFSRTLEKVEGNATIVHGNLKDEILKLKREAGKNILTGGVDIPSQLMQLDLIDEYYFVVQPLIAGDGRRLLEGISLPGRLQLKLVASKTFRSGCVGLHFVKD